MIVFLAKSNEEISGYTHIYQEYYENCLFYANSPIDWMQRI